METRFKLLVDAASQIILGKKEQIKLALVCFLINGHLLIEDIPGMGKTTFAKTIAKLLNLEFQRIQFTSDLLPADILGTAIFHRENNEFIFQAGPIFHQLILADEINRATPKTQSALLEAMEERQVTIENKTRSLPSPFFVIATQNPITQIGTFPLPESQLDRFAMCINLDYPDAQSERELLKGDDKSIEIENMVSKLELETIQELKLAVKKIKVSEAILDYCQALLEFSRKSSEFTQGLSPRSGIILLQAAKAWAMIEGREYVIPEDLQTVLPAIANHRLSSSNEKGLDCAFKIIKNVSL